MQRTQTLASVHSVGNSAADPRIKPVSYISFDAVVGRNSKFHGLTTAQEEELGGIEYRVSVTDSVAAIVDSCFASPWLRHWCYSCELSLATGS